VVGVVVGSVVVVVGSVVVVLVVGALVVVCSLLGSTALRPVVDVAELSKRPAPLASPIRP
jgi:hypothetical protein